MAATPPRRILVVDDNAELRDVITAVLEADGYAVTGAEDGALALARLRTETKPDLILLDLVMPVVDGWAFRKEQLRDPAIASVPVVILSGDTRAAEHAVALRAAGSLRKPVDLERLLATAARLCRPSRAA